MSHGPCTGVSGVAMAGCLRRNVARPGHFFDPGATAYGAVFVAGSFNGWAASDPAWSLTRGGDGNWTGTFTVGEGTFQYKLVADGTMLDYSICVLCTEVSDGNLHNHDDMPLVVAGGGGGALRPGRYLSAGGRRHADLWIAIARAMGTDLTSFGDQSSGPMPGVLV